MHSQGAPSSPSLLYSRLGEEEEEGPLRHSANKVSGEISARTSPSIQARNRCFVRAPSSKINIAGSLVGEEGRGGETLGSPGTTFALMSCSARQKQPHTCCKVRHAQNPKEKREIGFFPFSLFLFLPFSPNMAYPSCVAGTGPEGRRRHTKACFFFARAQRTRGGGMER